MSSSPRVGSARQIVPRSGRPRVRSEVLYAGQEPVPPETGIEKLDGRWFGSSQMAIAGVNLRLVYFGLNRQIGHHSFPFHRHDFAELVLTLRGEGHLLVGEPGTEKAIACRAGDVYVVPATGRHGARWDCETGESWDILLLQFELEIGHRESFFQQDQSLALQFAPFYEYFFARREFWLPLRDRLRRQVIRSAESLRRSLAEEPDLAPVLILNFWLWLIAMISRSLKQEGRATGEGLVIPLKERDARMERARELLADPASWSLPMPEIARKVGMSLYHFIREFRARYGQPPMHYRNQCVMQCAGRLLAHSDEPIYLIAEKCGYESQSAFAKAFLRHTGMAPLDYRRKFARLGLEAGPPRDRAAGHSNE